MDNFYLVLAYLVIGFILRRLPAMPENSGIVLNIYVLYVALPALILKNVPLLQFSAELLIPALTPWLLLCAVVAAVLALSKLFNWTREVNCVAAGQHLIFRLSDDPGPVWQQRHALCRGV